MFTSNNRIIKKFLLISLFAVSSSLSACGVPDRLMSVGQEPRLSAIEDPTSKSGYRPVALPMPAPEPTVNQANSLWASGSRAFFKDQRAGKVGDILTVKVDVSDSAALSNSTQRARNNSEGAELNALAGLEQPLSKFFLPAGVNPSNLADATSNSSSRGTGTVNRSEQLSTNVAAVVTQVLPNGNLVIEGKQEIRINYEVRELIITGIIRPEDIAADNTIDSDKIAEARIGYGGRGQISDVQQPRYGQQILDILLPF